MARDNFRKRALPLPAGWTGLDGWLEQEKKVVLNVFSTYRHMHLHWDRGCLAGRYLEFIGFCFLFTIPQLGWVCIVSFVGVLFV